MLRIFEMNGRPGPENPYLFNGDFVDRGSFSFEVITTLLAYKVCNVHTEMDGWMDGWTGGGVGHWLILMYHSYM